MKRFGIMLLMFLLMAPPIAEAAEDKNPAFKLGNLQVTAYDRLSDYELTVKNGVQEMLEVAGSVLVSITVDVTPEWTEDIKNARVDAKTIKFITPGGDEILMIGQFERYGQFRMRDWGYSDYRRNDWKEKPRFSTYNAVFAIPKETDSGRLQFGETALDVKIPASSADLPDPGDMVKINITQVNLVDRLQSQHRVGDLKPQPVTVLTGGFGSILEVQVEILPQGANTDQGNNFFWYTTWLALLLKDGQFIPTFGEMFMDRINDNVSHNLNRNSDGQFTSGTAKLYYAVPNDIGSFQLLYQGRPVAEYQMAGAATAGETPPKAESAPSDKPETTPENKGKALIKNLMKKVPDFNKN